MSKPPLLLTVLLEAQRAQALERFVIIRTLLKKGVTQAQIAYPNHVVPSTIQLWMRGYREKGLPGLASWVDFPNSKYLFKAR